jgi:hypothetical protein
MDARELRKALKAQDYRAALCMASKVRDNSELAARIKRAYNALLHPDFYKQIKQDPDAIVADGLNAVRERWKGVKI